MHESAQKPKANTTQHSGGTPTSSSSGDIQLKSSLRGMGYDDQVAALSPVQAKAGDKPVQKVDGDTGIQWVAGINIASASTYDAGGGHSYKDHGAHTTKAQHDTRLKTGVAPSGRQSVVPTSAPGSSKFSSNSDHQAALKAAETALITKNKGKTRMRGINGKIGVSGAGTIYTRENTAETATDVHVDVQVVDGKFNINTAFPTK